MWNLARGYKTHNEFHKYRMEWKLISDSFYHMLNSQKHEKNQVFLPILLRKTRQRRDVTYDVIDKLRRLGLSKCFPALCHKLIYEIAIFHSINGETCDKYRIWNEFSFHTVFMKRVVCFISPSLWRGDIKHTTSFINTVWNENSFQILFITCLTRRYATKILFYRVLLPILWQKTRQRRGGTYDVIDELRRLSLSKCFPVLCHKLIYEIAIFHSINRETCDKSEYYHSVCCLTLYFVGILKKKAQKAPRSQFQYLFLWSRTISVKPFPCQYNASDIKRNGHGKRSNVVV